MKSYGYFEYDYVTWSNMNDLSHGWVITVYTGDAVLSAMERGARRFRAVLVWSQCLVIHRVSVTHCGCFAF